MFHNVTIQLLRCLNYTELNSFRVYLSCKHPQSRQEIKLFEYLFALYPDFNDENLNMELLLNVVFEKENTAQQRKNLQNISYKLADFMKDFLVEQELERERSTRDVLLAMAYIRLGQQDLLDKLIRSYSAKAGTGLHIWSHLYLHQLHYLKYYAQGTIKTNPSEENLELSLKELNLASLAAKLRIAHEMESLKGINGRAPLSVFSVEEWQRLPEQIAQGNAYHQLYFAAYDLALNPEDARFFALKALYRDKAKLLSKDEQGNLLNALINYTAFAIKNQRDAFYTEALDLLKEGLTTELLLQDGQISPATLINVINTAGEAKVNEDASNLLETWKGKLPPLLEKETYALAKARLHLYEKQFEKIIEELNPTLVFTDKHLELSARVTLIQAYFELKNWRLFESQHEALRVLLRRDDDRYSPQHRTSYGNFIKMVKTLHLAQGKDRREKMTQRLQIYPLIVCKPWLMEKIAESGG